MTKTNEANWNASSKVGVESQVRRSSRGKLSSSPTRSSVSQPSTKLVT